MKKGLFFLLSIGVALFAGNDASRPSGSSENKPVEPSKDKDCGAPCSSTDAREDLHSIGRLDALVEKIVPQKHPARGLIFNREVEIKCKESEAHGRSCFCNGTERVTVVQVLQGRMCETSLFSALRKMKGGEGVSAQELSVLSANHKQYILWLLNSILTRYQKPFVPLQPTDPTGHEGYVFTCRCGPKVWHWSCLARAGWQKKSCPDCEMDLTERLIGRSMANPKDPGGNICPGCKAGFQ